MSNLQEAQNNMREGYGNGSVGVFVSGLVWLTAGFTASFYSSHTGILTLIFGGMLIFPLGLLVGKLLGISGSHDRNNALGKLAMEGTVWMIVSIPLAYGLSLTREEWFFQGMLLIIGGRYLTYQSIYGMRIYWLLGAVLGISGFALFAFRADSSLSALTGGMIEVLFGILMYKSFRSGAPKNK